MSALPDAWLPAAGQAARPAGGRQAGQAARPAGRRQAVRAGQAARVRACSQVSAPDTPPAAASFAPVRPSAAAPAGAGRQSCPLRLTRRGRVAALCAMVVASLAGLAAVSAQAATPGAGPVSARAVMARVIVQPGQTLWSIALRADPGGDPRLVIRQIIKVNALRDDNVSAGQQLRVPRE